MMRKQTFWLSLLLLSACDSADIKAGEEAVKNTMKDPESAQFRNVRKAEALAANYSAPDAISSNPPIGAGVCGEINAKNAMGGYNGYRGFAWEKETGRILTANKYGVLTWRGGRPISGEDSDSGSSETERLAGDLGAVGWDVYCADASDRQQIQKAG